MACHSFHGLLEPFIGCGLGLFMLEKVRALNMSVLLPFVGRVPGKRERIQGSDQEAFAGEEFSSVVKLFYPQSLDSRSETPKPSKARTPRDPKP